MSDIILHPTLGINPRMINTICAVCGKTDGSIVLLGKHNYADKCPKCGIEIYGGVRRGEACPKCKNIKDWEWERRNLNDGEQINNTGVCKSCSDMMQKGIILISVKDGETGTNPFRTGRIVCVKEEALRRMGSNDVIDSVIKTRMAFIEDSIWDQIGLPSKSEIEKQEENKCRKESKSGKSKLKTKTKTKTKNNNKGNR